MTSEGSDSMSSESILPSPLTLDHILERMQTQITELYTVVQKQQDSINEQFKLIHSLLQKSPKPKLPLLSPPEPFDGSADKSQSFLNSINLYIEGRSAEFTTSESKIYFAVSYMKEGKAKIWVDNLLQKQSITDHFPTWSAFVQSF